MSESGVFKAAVKLSPDRRAAYLDQACGTNQELRREVESLLRAHDASGSFLQGPPARPQATEDYEPITEGAGTVIGPYKLMEQIGEGGFGLVFVAEQQQPVRRKVALKIIKPGMDSKQVIARFEAERQALAMMDHQNIAKVFDAGTTDTGRPYFVMELVHGVPITEYCDANKLTPRQRLELFVPVCQAIQHAHQKGVIHRDIKPSNVLVTMYDDKPVPKVIDFGVAKAIEQRLTEKTVYTQFGTLVGTFEYMSPEQAEMNAFGVDTRSDIYSLGVLLYELLTGTTPLERPRLREAAFGEIVRLIKEEEPPRPSVRLSTSGALAKVAAARQTDPAKLSRLLRGELDWVVMRCLEKDRSRRYETANGLARDVERHLHDEPVEARPPSFGYRFRKMARRNKRALATAVLVGVLLLVAVGAVASSIGWAVRDQEARRAKLANQLELILAEVAGLEAEQKWPEALAAARRAEALVAGGGGDAALEARVGEVRADLELVQRLENIRLARTDDTNYESNSDWTDRAYVEAFRVAGVDLDAMSEEEVVQRLRARARVTAALAETLDFWGVGRRRKGNDDGARALFAVAQRIDTDPWRRQWREAMNQQDVNALKRLAAAPDLDRQPATTLCLVGMGLTFQPGKPDPESGVAVLRKAQQLYPGDPWVNLFLGMSLQSLGPAHRDEALSYFRAVAALRPDRSWSWFHIGCVLHYDQQKLDEAIACYRKAIALDPRNVPAHHNLGFVLQKQKKLDEAIACYRKAIALDPQFALSYSNLGNCLRDQGKLDETIASYRKVIELNPKHVSAHINLAMALKTQNKLDEAIACFRKAIDLDPKSVSALINLGIVLKAQNRLDEAIVCCRKAIELDSKSAWAHHTLGNALLAQNKVDEAIASFRRAIELNPNYAAAHNGLGNALKAQNKVDEAIACFRKAIEINPKIAHNNLGNALLAQNKVEEAIACFRKAIEINLNPATAYNGLGHALMAQNKVDEAVACFRKALVHARKEVELQPETANHWSNLGVALWRCGDFKAALEALVKVDQLSKGGHHRHRFYLAMAYWQVGEKGKARQAYEQGKEWMDKNQPNNELLRRFQAEAAELLQLNDTP